MEGSIVTNFRVKKYLKIFALISFFIFASLLIYGYVRIIPQDIKFSNVTSSSFTVSWSTKSPTEGSAFLIETKNKLPISASLFRNDIFNDTRDVRIAELNNTKETALNIWNRDSDGIRKSDFVTEEIISERGVFYTHHVDITGLDPEKEYSVMVGDGLLFLNAQFFTEGGNVFTTNVPEKIDTPIPVYGQIKDSLNEDMPFENLKPVTDGVVYLNYLDEETGERSNIFSSPLNVEGNWYIDMSMAVDKEGDLFVEKYSQNITNIMGELLIDLGPLGLWKNEINMNTASPAEPMVINIPGYITDEDAFGILRRVSKQNTTTVKGVSAQEAGCAWIGFCSYGRYDKEKKRWVDCSGVDDILERRKCVGQQDAHAAAQEVGGTDCANGGREGDYVFFRGQCRVCGGKGQNNYKKGWWVLTDENKCGDKTSGAIIHSEELNPPNGSCEGGTLCDLKDGKQGVCSAEKVCEDTIVNCGLSNLERRPCLDSTGDLSFCEFVDAPSFNTPTRCSEETTPPPLIEECETEGENCTIDGKKGKCVSPANNNMNLTCTIVKDFLDGGDICREDDSNLVSGTWDDKSRTCTSRTEGFTSEEIGKMACWAEGLSPLYINDQQGNRYQCNYKTSKFEKRPPLGGICKEGESCHSLSATCISKTGSVLVCPISLVPKWMSSDDMGNFLLTATEVEFLEGGQKCTNPSGCICRQGNPEPINNNEYCVENICFYKSDEGKVCNTSGNTCKVTVNLEVIGITLSSDVECTGEVKSSYKLRPSGNKVFAQELTNFETYIIDQTTGMISGISAGVYYFEEEGKTYMFTVREEDLKAGGGKVSIFIDNNNNGEYNEGTDKKVSEFASEIKISTIVQNYNYSFSTGFNFVTFPFLSENEVSRTAAGMLRMLNDLSNKSVFSIAKYDGSWKVVGENTEIYDTNDFQLIPGQGYIIKAKRPFTVSITGRPVIYDSTTDNAQITLYQGWNLIGTYGTNVKKYTAKSLLQGINNFEQIDFTADNVSRWESDIQRYDGFQITNQNGIDIEYGFDFPINTLQSYFIRILQGRGNWQQELE